MSSSSTPSMPRIWSCSIAEFVIRELTASGISFRFWQSDQCVTDREPPFRVWRDKRVINPDPFDPILKPGVEGRSKPPRNLVVIPVLFRYVLAVKEGIHRMRSFGEWPFFIKVAAESHDKDPLSQLRYSVISCVHHSEQNSIMESIRFPFRMIFFKPG